MEGRPASLVTGASGAIGTALALELAGSGHDLTLTGRDAGRLQATADLVASRDGGDVRIDRGDVRDVRHRRSLIGAHLATYGRLDVLVANAGSGRAAPLAQTDDETIAAATEVNLIAPFELVRDALRPMLHQGQGWVVLTASLSGIRPTEGVAAYSAAKAAMVSVARSVNLEHARDGVRACALCPGFVETPMSAWTTDRVPPTEMLRPADMTAALRFLLSLSEAAVVDELVLTRAAAPPFAP